MLAAQNGLEECVEWLIKAGADVNAKDRNQDTVLHKATFTGKLNCMELLVKSGASVNAADESGTTPLMVAAHNGSEKCTKWLIMTGADLNATNKYGHTALKTATLRRNKDCEKLLIGVKNQPDATDDKNKAPNNNADSEQDNMDEYETIWISDEKTETAKGQKRKAEETGIKGPEGKKKVESITVVGARARGTPVNPPMKGLHMMARDAIASQ